MSFIVPETWQQRPIELPCSEIKVGTKIESSTFIEESSFGRSRTPIVTAMYICSCTETGRIVDINYTIIKYTCYLQSDPPVPGAERVDLSWDIVCKEKPIKKLRYL
jgi:hypothetical protein